MNITDNFETAHFRFVNYVNMTEEQSREIWKGRNHPDVRKWMVNPEPFSFESHQSFVKSLSSKADRSYWCVLIKDVSLCKSSCCSVVRGGVIASFNLNPIERFSETKGEMGKYLLPEYMGKGLGKLCTQEFVRFLLTEGIVDEIYIKTLVNNIKNQHVNESAGFHKTYQDDTYVYMSIKKSDLKK